MNKNGLMLQQEKLGKGKNIAGVTSQFYHGSHIIEVVSFQYYHHDLISYADVITLFFKQICFNQTHCFKHILTFLRVTK